MARRPPKKGQSERQEIMGVCKEIFEEIIKKVRMEQSEMKEKLEENNRAFKGTNNWNEWDVSTGI